MGDLKLSEVLDEYQKQENVQSEVSSQIKQSDVNAGDILSWN